MDNPNITVYRRPRDKTVAIILSDSGVSRWVASNSIRAPPARFGIGGGVVYDVHDIRGRVMAASFSALQNYSTIIQLRKSARVAYSKGQIAVIIGAHN